MRGLRTTMALTAILAMGLPAWGASPEAKGGDGCAYCSTCDPPRLREIFFPTNPLSGDPLIERVCACH